MAKVKGTIDINIEKCKGCELCIAACPNKVLKLSDKINVKGYRYAMLYMEGCNACMSCALVCPDAVIKVYKKKIE
ncbi:MAG: 4Fe-4S dicluster domain-containing protein [Bacteroidota bacterium]|nr:4Fe-4S dicluster domain-containing protein [Bacteroidota bacterium]